jgi:multicomponent Na+:H+ antiporter subunit D
VAVLLALFMFGIGKAALMPFHRWLPAAMVAPTPVSALLHAVAVVKAGVFAVVKVVVYVFGIDFLSDTGFAMADVGGRADHVAGFRRGVDPGQSQGAAGLFHVSQLGYVVLGAALATSMGVIGGSMQIAMHAMGKITLFFCAGAIYTATHKTEISQMDGLGRAMPFTFGAFLIGALSIVGLPPLGGSWSKWYLLAGTADAGQWAMMAVLLVSSLLNVAYLLPIAARGFFVPSAAEAGIREAPLACVVPLCLTALGCVLLFFSADALYTLLAPIATR